MTKRKFYSDIQDVPQKGTGLAFGLLDASGNVIRGLAENAYQPKEDQRLRTTDYVTHGAVYSTDYVFAANSVYTDGYVSYFEDAPYTDYVVASKTMVTAHAVIDIDSSTVVLDLPSAPKAGWGSPNRPILTISVAKIRLMGAHHSIRHPDPSGVIKGINLNGMVSYSGRSVVLNQCGVYTVTMVSQYLYLISPFHA